MKNNKNNIELYGTRINPSKTFLSAMIQIYGIGQSTILEFAKLLSIKKDTRVNEISENQWNILRQELENRENKGELFGDKLKMKQIAIIKKKCAVNPFGSRVHRKNKESK